MGNIAIDTAKEDKLILIAHTGEKEFKKHYINMTEWNMYVVEDIKGSEANKYKYEIRYIPESVIPIDVTQG